MRVLFDPVGLSGGRSIEPFDSKVIEASLNLRQASLEDAVRYGGPITRAALDAMTFHGDRKYIVVDTRISMLLPGSYPSIPGWHTDGVPRGDDLDPGGKGLPNIEAQVNGEISEPRYHLLAGGANDAMPRFVVEKASFDVPNLDADLYACLSRSVADKIPFGLRTLDVRPWDVWEFDWWSIHSATAATQRGWRYLIRVTETDHITPRVKLDDFIRSHAQIYMPMEFGW